MHQLALAVALAGTPSIAPAPVPKAGGGLLEKFTPGMNGGRDRFTAARAT